MRIFERWYFGLCWNLRLVIIELWYLEGFWFLLVNSFGDYIFCMVKYLNFHNSTFALRYFVMFFWKGHQIGSFGDQQNNNFIQISGANGLHCSAVHSWIKEPCFSNKCKTMSCIRPEIHHLRWQPNSIFQASLERKVSDEEQF